MWDSESKTHVKKRAEALWAHVEQSVELHDELPATNLNESQLNKIITS